MNPVKVQSLDALKVFRAVLLKFVDSAQTVLSEADGELQRMQMWLETEADHYWEGQIRRRQEELARAKDALRAKKLFRPDGSKVSTVDEEKAVRQAQARLEEARQKLVNVHKYAVVLQKEMHQYKGQVQRFANAVAIDIPIGAPSR